MAEPMTLKGKYSPDNLTKRGWHHDGKCDGLYLQVAAGGSKSWIFFYQLDGKRRPMGLGGWPEIGLSEARRRADEARVQVAKARQAILDGADPAMVDPVDTRKAARAARKVKKVKARTFKECAEDCIAAKEPSWKNPKLAALWKSTLATYAEPIIGDLPVADVTTDLVFQVLQPIWTEKPETASRVRMRIEAVLDWAKAKGLRTGENPAVLKGNLAPLLSTRNKAVKHHSALAYKDLAGFMAELRKREGISARALEFLVLCASRTGEVIGARWEEVNLAEKIWTIPAARMKAKRDHRVALSDRAVEILRGMGETKTGDYVFPSGPKLDRPLSNMALLALLKRMGRADLTAHGFRSSFRDWCAEQTDFPGEVAEMALAHVVSDKVEAAYRRGDMLEKRFALAQQWADYCVG